MPPTVNVATALSALSAGLHYIPGTAGVLGSALVTGAQQVPSVAKLLFPIDTADSRSVQVTEIGSNLDPFLKTLGGNLP